MSEPLLHILAEAKLPAEESLCGLVRLEIQEKDDSLVIFDLVPRGESLQPTCQVCIRRNLQ